MKKSKKRLREREFAYQTGLWRRIESRIQKTWTCWIWKGATCGGYGVVSIHSHPVYVPRLMYLRYNGSLPRRKPWVLHTCDNPICVNPHHLYAGTCRDNVRDMMVRKRHHHAFKKLCEKGHPLEGPNMRREGKYRRCRTCKNLTMKAYWKIHDRPKKR